MFSSDYNLPVNPIGTATVDFLLLLLRVLSHRILFQFPSLGCMFHIGKGAFFVRFLGLCLRQRSMNTHEAKTTVWKEKQTTILLESGACYRNREVGNSSRAGEHKSLEGGRGVQLVDSARRRGGGPWCKPCTSINGQMNRKPNSRRRYRKRGTLH
jgi:hypothetical protein